MPKQVATYDVIIIGSGIGGLSAGLTLQTLKPEMKSLILEQHNAPGGYISGFRHNGYYFDSGAEGLVMCGENQNFRQSIASLGINPEYIRVDPLEVLHFPDKTVTMYADPIKYEEELIEKFPENEDEIKKLFKVLRKIHNEFNNAVKEGVDPSFKDILKIGLKCPQMRKYAFMSYKDFLTKFISNEQLKKVLSVYILWYGIPSASIKATAAAIMFFSPVFDGYFYPRGGMLNFAESMVNTYEHKGGEIRYKSKVSRIITKRRTAIGVELSDGTFIKGKWIISNADLKRTIFEYVDYKKIPNRYLVKIAKLNQSISGFSVFLGLDKELKDYPSHLVYNLDPEECVRGYLENDFNPKEVLLRIPTKIDRGLLNKGKSSVILFTFAPYNWRNKWKFENRKEYNRIKKYYADKLIKLAENMIPDLSKHITSKLIATPLTFERYTLNTEGAWYGAREGSGRIGRKTPIRRLFFAGANIVSGGLPPCFYSGMNTAKHIINRFSASKRTLRVLFPFISHWIFKLRSRAILSMA